MGMVLFKALKSYSYVW